MEQDDLAPAARQGLEDMGRLRAERLNAAKAKAEKLRKAMEARAVGDS